MGSLVALLLKTVAQHCCLGKLASYMGEEPSSCSCVPALLSSNGCHSILQPDFGPQLCPSRATVYCGPIAHATWLAFPCGLYADADAGLAHMADLVCEWADLVDMPLTDVAGSGNTSGTNLSRSFSSIGASRPVLTSSTAAAAAGDQPGSAVGPDGAFLDVLLLQVSTSPTQRHACRALCYFGALQRQPSWCAPARCCVVVYGTPAVLGCT